MGSEDDFDLRLEAMTIHFATAACAQIQYGLFYWSLDVRTIPFLCVGFAPDLLLVSTTLPAVSFFFLQRLARRWGYVLFPVLC